MSEKSTSDTTSKSENVSSLPYTSPFDAIRRTSSNEQEYWSARDLAKILGYTEYGKFKNAIQKAEIACAKSGQDINYHFAHVSDMIKVGKGAKRKVEDIHLTRYACYLLVENADPNKPIVAMGQTYFAEQTRRAEILTDEFNALPEAQKRLYLRGEMNVHNTKLAATARQAGVIEPKDFAIFQDHGYMGLYGGEGAAEIAARKQLAENQHILDYMGSEELGANIFRATQTEAKLRRDQINTKDAANHTHYEVGQKVRKAIEDIGGTMPEQLPTPTESVQQLDQKERERLKRGPQLTMFDDDNSSEATATPRGDGPPGEK